MSGWKKKGSAIIAIDGFGEKLVVYPWVDNRGLTFEAVNRAGEIAVALNGGKLATLAKAILEWSETGKPLTECLPVDPRREELARVDAILARNLLMFGGGEENPDNRDGYLLREILTEKRDRLKKELGDE